MAAGLRRIVADPCAPFASPGLATQPAAQAGSTRVRGSLAPARARLPHTRPRHRPTATSVPWWLPNTVSLAGGVLCIGAAVVLAADGPLVGAALLFTVGAVCDAIDGPLARQRDQTGTRRGGVVDSAADKVGEFALFAGLLVWLDDPALMQLLGVAFACGVVASGIKDVAEKHHLAVGWPEARYFGRAGRAALLSATLLAAALMDGSKEAFSTGFVALVAFNGSTALWRLQKFTRSLARNEFEPAGVRAPSSNGTANGHGTGFSSRRSGVNGNAPSNGGATSDVRAGDR